MLVMLLLAVGVDTEHSDQEALPTSVSLYCIKVAIVLGSMYYVSITTLFC